MAYSTFADINNELNDINGLVPDGKEVRAWVENKIASADMEIDVRLSGKYVTPVTNTDALRLLRVISLNLTCYYVLRQNYTQEDGNASDWVAEYKRTASDILQSIIDGTVSLLPDDIGDVAVSSTRDVGRRLTSDKYDTDGGLIETGTIGDWMG